MSETFKVKVKRTETYTATVELVAETQQQADERIRDRLDAEGWEGVFPGTDGDLCDSWSEVLGAGSPQTVIVRALQSVADLIEATYDHDEDGNRTDMDCPMSGADVTESLMGMETAIFEALEQAKTSADVFAIVRELVAWESQQGGWEAPCWDRARAIIAGKGDRVGAESPHGVDVEVTTSELDGTPVVQIDTPDLAEDARGPKVRVYLNDGTLYENPPYEKQV